MQLLIVYIAILVMSVVIHEVSHGLAANALGDPTARYSGRLTLNPLLHIDPFGSILLPALFYFVAGVPFGYAKPVPYNPYNLRNQQWGPALVGIAGPFSNILLALLFGLSYRALAVSDAPYAQGLATAFGLVVLVNLALAILNLLPIPPLDGSKVIYAFLPFRYLRYYEMLEIYGFFLVFFVVFYLSNILIHTPLNFSFRLFTGTTLDVFLRF